MIVFGYILLRHLFRWFIVIYCDSCLMMWLLLRRIPTV